MNVLKISKKITIITLLKNNISQHEICRKTGIHRSTIRKYAIELAHSKKLQGTTEELEPSKKAIQNVPGWPPDGGASKQEERHHIPEHARSACEPHREWIEKQVRLGRNAVSIYQDLVEQFVFTNAYNSVKRFVRGLKRIDPEQFDRLEFDPGEEAQVDYGQGAPTRHPKTGKYRKPRLFVMTLKYSRRAFRKVVWESSKEVWAKLHEEAFRYFGGGMTYVVLDNLKEGVLKPDIYEPELNPVYEAMLKHYGVTADPARLRDPNRKGTVENGIQHTQDTALKGRKFETIEEQNEWLMHWEETWAAPRIHGRMKRQVEEMFQEEKPYLKKLPLTGFRYFEQETRTVWDDACIQVSNSYYAARPALIGSEVIVRIYDSEIEIIDKQTLLVLRRHFRSYRPGYVSMEPGDRIFNPSRKTRFILKQASKIGPKTLELCERLFKNEGRMGQRRMRGIVALARKYKASHIEEASLIALAHNVRSCKAVREMVKRKTEIEKKEKIQKTTGPVLTQTHELIRPPSDYASFWEQYALQEELFPKDTIH